MWALGATLQHAASGKVPFPRPRAARHSRDRLVRSPQLALEEPPPLPDHLPEAFRALVRSMLAPDPAARPAAAEVAAALEPLVLDVPTKPTVSRRRLPLSRAM